MQLPEVTSAPNVTTSTRNIPDRGIAKKVWSTFSAPEPTGLFFIVKSRHTGTALGFGLLNMDFLIFIVKFFTTFLNYVFSRMIKRYS